MATTGISNNTATSASGSIAKSTAKQAQLSQDQFFKVLTAQLTQQDPLKPMDSQDFLAQLVQLQNLQVSSDLANNFAGMLSQNALSSAAALLGKMVTGTDASGASVSGQVSGISVSGGNVQLAVGASSMPLANVTQVVDPAVLSASALQ